MLLLDKLGEVEVLLRNIVIRQDADTMRLNAIQQSVDQLSTDVYERFESRR